MHSVPHRTLVDTSEDCTKPGTMCAILASSGSQGIDNFQVCVDRIFLPPGRFITKGFVACDMLVTGVPQSTNFPVMPTSTIAMLTAILIYGVLNRVSTWVGCSSFCCWMVYFQILCLDSNGLVVVSMVGPHVPQIFQL